MSWRVGLSGWLGPWPSAARPAPRALVRVRVTGSTARDRREALILTACQSRARRPNDAAHVATSVSLCGLRWPWVWRQVEPAVDVDALHAKIGQLTLENDFFGCVLLGPAIHCVVKATARPRRASGS